MLKKIFTAVMLVLVAGPGIGQVVKPGVNIPAKTPVNGQVLLSNGWKLSPAGTHMLLGDLPLNMALSTDARLLAVTNNGQSKQSLQLIDVQRHKQLDSIELKKSWYGLAFSRDGKRLYASGGNDNIILGYDVSGRKLKTLDTIRLGKPWPVKVGPTGMVLNNAGNRLYCVTKEDSCLYVINTENRAVLNKVKLPAEGYSCLLSPDNRSLYISLWGGGAVGVYSTVTGKLVNKFVTQDHPNELLLNRKGTTLFVANANDNSVSVINTATGRVLENINTTLYPVGLTGSTTNGLALSGDEKTLYIANADNNCLAVFNVAVPGKSSSMGFIPVGWYPTNVKVAGKTIMVSNGKGFSSLPNPQGPQPVQKEDNSGRHTGQINNRLQYIAGLFKGTLSFIPTPDAATLKKYTKMVYANTPVPKPLVSNYTVKNNPVLTGPGGKSPIKYIFYLIKENRTYDQVLGDVEKGMGDSSLCIFGERVTPNLHKIVNDFVLMDNCYVDAEVSADGHNWSMAAYATDFTEKTWPTSYGGRGGNYDFEGTRKTASPKKGYIWDYCKRAGVSYRSYGEFAGDGVANIPALVGHICMQSPEFDMNITDRRRVEIWKHDIDSLIKIGKVPQFSTIRVGNDHTSGQKIGEKTPIAHVADNDQAVGMFIEYLSHMPIWKESLVCVVEDDAQNGPDHIDAHRSTMYLAGPYVKRNYVNHNMYSTSGMLRTMELILGLPPMSQYDAAAMPMFESFTDKPDFTPYVHVPARVDMEARNVKKTPSAALSEKWNFRKEDSAPDVPLNEVVWKAVKGESSIMPAPRRGAFVLLEKKAKDDDD